MSEGQKVERTGSYFFIYIIQMLLLSHVLIAANGYLDTDRQQAAKLRSGGWGLDGVRPRYFLIIYDSSLISIYNCKLCDFIDCPKLSVWFISGPPNYLYIKINRILNSRQGWNCDLILRIGII